MSNQLRDKFKKSPNNFDGSEKKLGLLLVFMILFLCIIFYFIPYKSLDKKQKVLKNEIQTLEATYNQLVDDIPKRELYEKGIEEGNKKMMALEKQLPSGLEQELIIQTINDLEKTIGIRLPSVSLGTLQLLSMSNNPDTPNPVVGSEEVGAEVDPNTVQAEEVAMKVEVQTTAILDYSKLKSLINYFKQADFKEGYKKRVAIKNIQLSSDPDSGDINTAFSLHFYGLQAEGRPANQIDLGKFNIGKAGVFIPIPKYGIQPVLPEISKEEKEPVDFFIRLSSITADQTTVVVGTGNSGSSYVFADGNTFIDVTIELKQVDGKYYYTYQAGSDVLTNETANGNQFNPGNSLDISVLSSKRGFEDDKSGANVTIINKTDLPLTITKFNDDTASPRFKLVKTEGKVNVK